MAALAVAFFLVLPFQYLLIGIQWYGLFAIMIPVYTFLILPIFPVIRQETTHFLERTARLQWGLMLTVYCVSHAPALLLLTIPNYARQNALLLFYLVFVTQVSDVLQYVFGKLLGRTSIAPAVSPSKTLEGLVGGGSRRNACGTLLWWITPFTPIQALGFAALIVVFGFVGGLVLSAVKRSLGVKDWAIRLPVTAAPWIAWIRSHFRPRSFSIWFGTFFPFSLQAWDRQRLEPRLRRTSADLNEFTAAITGSPEREAVPSSLSISATTGGPNVWQRLISDAADYRILWLDRSGLNFGSLVRPCSHRPMSSLRNDNQMLMHEIVHQVVDEERK